jgi:hypothetical protein
MKRLIPIFLLVSVGLTGCGNYNPISVVQFLTTASKSDSGDSDDNSHSGGAGSGPVNTPPAVPPSSLPPPVQLQSITVTPPSASIPAGRSQEYSAEGTYSDGTTHDITSQVQWGIEAPIQIASFSWNGRGWNQANGQFQGTGSVTATLDGVTGRASLTVREAELVGLSVSPTIQEIGIGSIQDFVPQGPFTDNLYKYSFPINCHLSDTTVARLIDVGGSYCRVEGLSAGTVTLTLSSGEFSVEATVNVLPLTPFGRYLFLSGPRQEIAIDETGGQTLVLKAVADPMTGAFDLFGSRRDRGGHWSDQQSIGVGPIGRDDTFAIDMASDGSILLVGTHSEGIYSARYLPGQGWQGIETVSASPLSPVNDSSLYRLQVGYDAGGNGIAVWTVDEKVFSSEYRAGLGWSIPIMREYGSAPVLAMNESGKAILVWQKRTGTLPRAGFTIYMYTPYASAYTAESGWSVPVVLDTFEFAHQPNVAINESGEAIAVWGHFQQSHEIMTARMAADGSWTPAEILVESGGCASNIVMDGEGNGLILCGAAVQKAYHYRAGSGWQPPIDLGEGALWQMKLDSNGDALVTLVGDSSFKTLRYDHLRGWQPMETLDVPREGFMYPWLGMNSAGEAVIYWNAFFQLWNLQEKRFEFHYETYVHALP